MKSLKDITKSIKKEYKAMSILQMKSLDKAKAIGSDLIEAKKLLRHGEFNQWCKENFAFSDRSRTNYMTIARNWCVVEEAKQTNPQLGLNDALDVIKEKNNPNKQGQGDPKKTDVLDVKEQQPKKKRGVYSMPFNESSGLLFHLEQINTLLSTGEYELLNKNEKSLAQIEFYKLKANLDCLQKPISHNHAA